MTARLLSIPADRYHADDVGEDVPTLSSSVLRTMIEKSPLHAKEQHPKLTANPVTKSSDAMNIGSALHAMLLQGRDVVVPLDVENFRTQAAKDERAAAAAYGMIGLKRDDYDRVVAMHDAVRPQLAASHAAPPLLVDGKAEQTIVWEDRGVVCRALIDWLRDDFVAIEDVKTEGRNGNPADWERTMFDRERLYHVQGQFYRRAVRALGGRLPECRFVVVESQPPHAVSVISLGDRAIALADEQIDYYLDVWARCLQTGEWPAYTNQVAYIDPPAWAESAWLDRQFVQEAAA